jgi:hypothetical protein
MKALRILIVSVAPCGLWYHNPHKVRKLRDKSYKKTSETSTVFHLNPMLKPEN